MGALGVNLLLRKAALISTPIMEVSLDQGVWTIKQSTTLKTMEMKFKVGVECDDVTPDGREVKMIVTNEEGAFLMLQKAKKLGEKSTKSTRKMVGKNEMIYTMGGWRVRHSLCPEVQENCIVLTDSLLLHQRQT